MQKPEVPKCGPVGRDSFPGSSAISVVCNSICDHHNIILLHQLLELLLPQLQNLLLSISEIHLRTIYEMNTQSRPFTLIVDLSQRVGIKRSLTTSQIGLQ